MYINIKKDNLVRELRSIREAENKVIGAIFSANEEDREKIECLHREFK